MQRGQLALGAGVDVDRRALEQLRDYVVKALGDRDHEGGPAIVVVADVDVAAAGELFAHLGQVARQDCAVQRRHRPIVSERDAALQWSALVRW